MNNSIALKRIILRLFLGLFGIVFVIALTGYGFCVTKLGSYRANQTLKIMIGEALRRNFTPISYFSKDPADGDAVGVVTKTTRGGFWFWNFSGTTFQRYDSGTVFRYYDICSNEFSQKGGAVSDPIDDFEKWVSYASDSTYVHVSQKYVKSSDYTGNALYMANIFNGFPMVPLSASCQ